MEKAGHAGGRVSGRVRGQTMLEYVLVFSALFGVALVLYRLVKTVRHENASIQELVSSEYP